MNAIYSSQTKLSKKNTKRGLLIGTITGIIVGTTVGVTTFTISGAGLSIATTIVIAFAVAITLSGTFMGLLFDLDARERNLGESIEQQTTPVVHKQIDCGPVARYLL